MKTLLSFIMLASLAGGLIDVGNASAREVNLVRNGSFRTAEARGVASGWSLAGPGVVASLQPDLPRNGQVSQRIQSTGRSTVTFWQEVAVEPRSELYFHAWVKSDDRVFARVGRLRMAYTEQGRWQKLVGLIRTGNATRLKITFFLGGLTKQTNILWINDVVLRRTQRPTLPPRRTIAPATPPP